MLHAHHTLELGDGFVDSPAVLGEELPVAEGEELQLVGQREGQLLKGLKHPSPRVVLLLVGKAKVAHVLQQNKKSKFHGYQQEDASRIIKPTTPGWEPNALVNPATQALLSLNYASITSPPILVEFSKCQN